MSGGPIEKCGGGHAEDASPVATGLVRYVQRDGTEVFSAPLCDQHQAGWCAMLRADERRGEIRELGAVPLDHRERMAQARNAGKVRRELERITTPELHPINLDPYPGTIGDVADEVARFVLELEASGAARGLRREVIERLAGPVVNGPSGPVVDPADFQ